jgi:NADH-quinone oxidoreductase subunit H
MYDILQTLINGTFGWGWPDWLIHLISYIVIVTIILIVAPFQMLFFT